MAYINFTNCTEQEYLDIIYSQDDKNRIKIWFDNVELQDAGEYCVKLSGTNRILPNDGNKRFALSNFVAKEYELVLRDLPVGTVIQDQVRISIGTLVDENNNIYEDVPIGIFNIQDTPKTDKNKVTIKLRDNRVKFDFNYNAKPLIDNNGGSATKKQILDDICSKAGVINTINSFNGDNDLIAIYDNSILGSTYVSYLLEQAGLIPTINREGNLKAIDLSNLKTWRIPLSIVEKYEIGTPYQIKRVCYEQGIIKYETSNDETLDTLYLDSGNMYITRQDQINTIFNIVEDFQVDSVTTGKILGNPAIDPYDIIEIYDDGDENEPTLFSTLANNTYTFNGVHRNKFDTQIGKEERTENVSKNSDSTFKYTIKSEVNNLEGSVSNVISQTIDTGNPDSAVNKVSRLTQRVDSLESEISNVTGMVATKDSTSGSITFTDETNESEPITIKVYPTSESISYLYPHSGLYPSSTTYLKNRKIRFYNNTTSEVVYEYELPDDLLYYDSTHYDEFYLDLNSQTCQVTKRCKYNADGTIGLLTNEQTDNYTYPLIELTEGIYTISLLGYNAGYILTTLMAKNIYTDQFYTKVETDSKIRQTADNIELGVSQTLSNYSTTDEMNSAINVKANGINSVVSQKVGNNEIISKINQSPEQVQINANKIKLEGYTTINDAFSIDEDGYMDINSNINGLYNYNNYDLTAIYAFMRNNLSLSSNAILNALDFDNNGQITYLDYVNVYKVINNEIGNTKYIPVKFKIDSKNPKHCVSITDENDIQSCSLGINGIEANLVNAENVLVTNDIDGNYKVAINGATGDIYASGTITQGSKEELKKNIKKFDNGLDAIKNTNIYEFNYLTEKDDAKKHIGFIIGDKYKYSEKITNSSNTAVDIYSMVSICFKAIQEQQKQIENLQKEIANLKKESDK